MTTLSSLALHVTFSLERIGKAGVLCLIAATLSYSQPFPQAHAHNDYAHPHPLFDALNYGFISVEADVHLVRGKLLVSHSRPVHEIRTLEELYLSPLDSIVRANSGKIYPAYDGTFFLMIDIKTEAESTYRVLREVLLRYPALLRTSEFHHPITIFLSGNRPMGTVVNDPASLVALDGRPSDLGKFYTVAVMPVISDNYKNWSDGNGKGTGDLKKISALANRVHAEGKKLRLWAIPDNPEAWRALLAAGVDLISTDHLSELNEFMRTRKK